MPADVLAQARSALERGDVLIAYDEAMSAVALDPDDLDARYTAVLALARSGAGRRAADEADALQQTMEARPDVSRRLREDVAALGARIAKDRALRAEPAARASLAADAARRYETVADQYGGYYAGINAATLWLVAGDGARSAALARRSLDLVAEAGSTGADDDYWLGVTEAEAHLLLGEVDAARVALQRTADVAAGNVAARAATRRQLRIICGLLGTDEGLLDALHLPQVVHYCGHVMAPGGESEDAIRAQVGAFLDRENVGIAYGSLAAGADLVVAEALLERGGELNVVLPFDAEEFAAVSVRPSGDAWVPRFRRCLDRAASVVLASDSQYLGDEVLFGYASRIAMGHARNRAAALGGDAAQLAVWDGLPARGPGGTADDVAIWRAAGGHGEVIPAPPDRSAPAVAGSSESSPTGRAVRAILFSDLRGFSSLHDQNYVATIKSILEPLAAVVDEYGDAVLGRNSWGDGIHLVFASPVAAGHCALQMQEVNAELDWAAADLPAALELRIGLHVGPVFEIVDPLRGAMTWWGREVTRAARIEPRTPEGSVYATDAFAALLALEPDSGLASEYVGRVTTAKAFETIPMYRVRRTERATPRRVR